MEVITSEIVILSRTQMKNGICVGGYCVVNKKYVRLLDDKARQLKENEPYNIGELYGVKYLPRYDSQLKPPHIEDIVVYEKEFDRKVEDKKFLVFIHTHLVKIRNITIHDLFDGCLHWENGSGYILKDNIPNGSVIIVCLNHNLTISKRIYGGKEHVYFCFEISNLFYKVKYVGCQKLTDNMIIPAGTAIRFSLVRWWDKNGDGKERSYLQLSGFYM